MIQSQYVQDHTQYQKYMKKYFKKRVKCLVILVICERENNPGWRVPSFAQLKHKTNRVRFPSDSPLPSLHPSPTPWCRWCICACTLPLRKILPLTYSPLRMCVPQTFIPRYPTTITMEMMKKTPTHYFIFLWSPPTPPPLKV